MESMSTICMGKTRRGVKCKNKAKQGRYCRYHTSTLDPANASNSAMKSNASRRIPGRIKGLTSKQSREVHQWISIWLAHFSDAARPIFELGTLLGQGASSFALACTFKGKHRVFKISLPEKKTSEVLETSSLILDKEKRRLLSSDLASFVLMNGFPSAYRVRTPIIYHVWAQDEGASITIMERLKSLPVQAMSGGQIRDGLRNVQRLGFHVVHRDIKPANMGVDNDGSIVLFDFDLARMHRFAKIEKDPARAATGYQVDLAGSTLYMSDARLSHYPPCPLDDVVSFLI